MSRELQNPPLRLSKYVMAYRVSSTYGVLSNWMTGFSCLLDWNTASLFKTGLKSSALKGKVDTRTQRYLLRECFVPEESDEVSVFQAKLTGALERPRYLTVTAVAGFACNMRCPYCFVSGYPSTERMNAQTLDDFSRWVRWLAEKHHPSVLFLHLYGGEPLLYNREFGKLLPELAYIAGEISARTELQISTNGVLLEATDIRAAANRLWKTHIQVTLDGPPRVHNRRRLTRNGSDSFTAIIRGIKDALEWATVRIRVNVDAQNHATIPELMDLLVEHRLHEHCALMLFPTQYPISESTQHCESFVLPLQDAGPIMANLWLEMARRKIPAYGSLPYPGFCMHWHPHAYAISPQGDVHKCVGGLNLTEERIGHVSRPNETKPVPDPDNDYPRIECRNCGYLPICGGGCRIQRRRMDLHLTVCPIKRFNESTMSAFLRCKLASGGFGRVGSAF